MTIILSRTDNLGDVVLTLPVAGALKERYPSSTIIFLCSAYTAPIVRCSRFVDSVVTLDELRTTSHNQAQKLLCIDADTWCFHLYPRPEIARLIQNLGIRHRVGTRNRLYHWWTCNHLPALSRKNSSLHEAQLNLRLLEPLTGNIIPALNDIPGRYGLEHIPHLPEHLMKIFHPLKKNLIIHPKSQGSAPAWNIEQYVALITSLPAAEYRFILTGSAREGELSAPLLALGGQYDVVPLFGKTSLAELLALIARADGLLASSTGPLHLAAATGRQTLGLFTALRPMHAGRWGPIGIHAETLTAPVECSACHDARTCRCMASITPKMVADVLHRWKKMP